MTPHRSQTVQSIDPPGNPLDEHKGHSIAVLPLEGPLQMFLAPGDVAGLVLAHRPICLVKSGGPPPLLPYPAPVTSLCKGAVHPAGYSPLCRCFTCRPGCSRSSHVRTFLGFPCLTTRATVVSHTATSRRHTARSPSTHATWIHTQAHSRALYSCKPFRPA